MVSRLITIACLAVSLLAAHTSLGADRRSVGEGVRAGPRSTSSVARRSSVSQTERSRGGANSPANSPSPGSNRGPRWLLIGLALGGAWLAYRKYGREVPPTKVVRIGGAAAMGLALVYFVFVGRTSPRTVASSGAARHSAEEPRAERSPRGREEAQGTETIMDRGRGYEEHERPERSVTRRNRLSTARRGTLYDHPGPELDTSVPPTPEPSIPVDPALLAAISQPGKANAPGLFVADEAQPLAAQPSQHVVPRKAAQNSSVATTVKAAVPSGVGTAPNASTASVRKSPTPSPKVEKVAPTQDALPKTATKKPATAAPAASTKPSTRTETVRDTPPTSATAAAPPKMGRKDPSLGSKVESGKSLENAVVESTAPIGVIEPVYYQSTTESGSSGSGGASSGGAAPTGDGTSGQSNAIGIAPPKEIPEFLRQESVLLDPGEYQIEFGLLYVLTQSSGVLQLETDDASFVGDIDRRQRLMLANLDFRIGITPKLQGSVYIPFGWASGEIVFAGQDQVSSSGGLGDIGLSLTRLIREGDSNSAQILMNFGMSAPTGQHNFVSSVSTPGSQLGQGFYTMTGGITIVRVFDPIVLFGGVGVQHRFDTEVAPGVTLSPGELAYYRFGLGWAVNNRVTLNGSFSGSYLTDIALNNRRVAGSAREPMSLRLAATIARAKRHGDSKPKLRTVEPHLTFGITDSAPAVQMGVSWSY